MVRVIRGLIYPAPPLTTEALQAALGKRVSKRDARLAARVGVFPIPGRSEVVVGESLAHAPLVFPERRQLDLRSPFALAFPAVSTSLCSAEIGGLGEMLVDRLDLDGEPQTLLLSDDGGDGMLVWGYTRWRAGPAYEGGRVHTHAFDLGNDEAMRVVGVTFAQVGGASPLAVLDEGLDGFDFEEARDAARRETLALYDSATEPFCWHLVSGSQPRGP